MRQVVEIVGVVLVAGVASHFGFQLSRGATPAFWLTVGAPTVALALYACQRLASDGELKELVRPQLGDLTKGFFGAAFLFALAVTFTKFAMPPGSPREAWLMRVYLQLGDPADLRQHIALVGAAVFLLASAEEVLWRGLVTRSLAELIGSRRAWVYAAVLYAAAHVPTIFALGDARSGPNPVMVVAALGGGLLWGAMARVSGRLFPGILAHALFDWCVVVLFRLWGAPV